MSAMLATPLSAELERRGGPEPSDLEVRIETLWQQAVTTWRGIELDQGTFLAYLAARWPEGASLNDWLTNAHVSDLYLACACAFRIPGAVELFDSVHLSRVRDYLVRSGPDDAFLSDVCQSLREKLFVGEARKIEGYSGRGPLGGWVRVLALRTAIDLRRRRGERLPDLQAARPEALDPELGYVAERYRGEVEEAVRHALTALDSEQRTLLRMHFVDAVTLDELARLRKVHRATIARHLAAARKAALDEIRRRLRERLAVSTEEFVSLIRLVRSRLQISIARLLAQ